jgi:hypothetical protein
VDLSLSVSNVKMNQDIEIGFWYSVSILGQSGENEV